MKLHMKTCLYIRGVVHMAHQYHLDYVDLDQYLHNLKQTQSMFMLDYLMENNFIKTFSTKRSNQTSTNTRRFPVQLQPLETDDTASEPLVGED